MECRRTACRDILLQDTGRGDGWWGEDGVAEVARDNICQITMNIEIDQGDDNVQHGWMTFL